MPAFSWPGKAGSSRSPPSPFQDGNGRNSLPRCCCATSNSSRSSKRTCALNSSEKLCSVVASGLFNCATSRRISSCSASVRRTSSCSPFCASFGKRIVSSMTKCGSSSAAKALTQSPPTRLCASRHRTAWHASHAAPVAARHGVRARDPAVVDGVSCSALFLIYFNKVSGSESYLQCPPARQVQCGLPPRPRRSPRSQHRPWSAGTARRC